MGEEKCTINPDLRNEIWVFILFVKSIHALTKQFVNGIFVPDVDLNVVHCGNHVYSVAEKKEKR